MRTVEPLVGAGLLIRVEGRQAVVSSAADDSPVIEAVVTGSRERLTITDFDTVEVVPYPRNVGTCSGCGDVWVWHGERTSHDRRCHETFEGGAVWDAHRVLGADGRSTCRMASAVVWRGHRLRKVTDVVPGVVTTGTWRGPAPEAGVFGKPADMQEVHRG